MVAQTAAEAVTTAYAHTVCIEGRCLAYVRTWLGIGSHWPTAARAWFEADKRHPGDRHPPAGAPMFWTGGSHGFGHIALSLGDGDVRSTDVPHAGLIGTVPLDWFGTHWTNLHYEGWAEDLNETTIGYLSTTPTPVPDPAPTPHVRTDGDTMKIIRDDNGTISYWIVSGGKRASIGQADAATWTGPQLVVKGDQGWAEIVRTYPTA